MARRHTKIVATLGPASSSKEKIAALMGAGVNVFRLNFSHGTHAVHKQNIETIRALEKQHDDTIGIVADLQGPKLRVGKVAEDTFLTVGETFTFFQEERLGNAQGATFPHPEIYPHLVEGTPLLLDDGNLQVSVIEQAPDAIKTRVIVGGKLSSHKGVNIPSIQLPISSLTEKDRIDLQFILGQDIDFIALSFVQTAADIHELRQLIPADKKILAKIEKPLAIQHMAAITEAADGLMVARGDLAVEIGEEYVPSMQKKIIQHARTLDKIVITATQMMESMIESPTPTRAEVSDVVNAILDGTDTVMLSAETAAGKYPVKVIKEMNKICSAAEQDPITRISKHRVECHFNRIDEAIAMSAMYAANHMDVKAIIAMTESGSTPLWMSRIRSSLPIYALTPNTATMGRMSLCLGVEPIAFSSTDYKPEHVNTAAIDLLIKRKLIHRGDLVLLTCGDHIGLHGGTNQIKILKA